MNPDAVEWLESQELVHPWIARVREDAPRHDEDYGDGVGPAAIRQMIELIDDHSSTPDACFRCGYNVIVL